MPSFKDLSGQKIGMWTVILRAGTYHLGGSQFLCRCDCGTEKIVRGATLAKGESRSCGCGRSDMIRAQIRTHGASYSRTYKSWSAMHSRCRATRGNEYKYYGLRGIKVCPRWSAFGPFLADMGERPVGKTLDRIDGNKGYFKDNCRWASRREQQRNTSRCRWISFGGKKQLVADWALELGLSHDGISWRLANWPIERALTAPRQW